MGVGDALSCGLRAAWSSISSGKSIGEAYDECIDNADAENSQAAKTAKSNAQPAVAHGDVNSLKPGDIPGNGLAQEAGDASQEYINRIDSQIGLY